MRLTRLRAKCEVRRTADSANTRSGGQACPEPKAVPEQGRMGWLETECPEVRVQKPRRPVLDADAGSPRQGRSQSVHSSEEASNDRGAKGHRKLVGAMTVEDYKRSSIVPKKAVRAGAAKAAGNRVALKGAAPTRTPHPQCGRDGAVKRLPRTGQPVFVPTSDWKAGCPKRACPVWREGRGSNPRPYPYLVPDPLRH